MERTQRVDHPDYTEDWDFYFSNVDGKPGSIFLDLGLKRIAPLSEKTRLLWVAVLLNKPGANGMQTDEEFSLLKEIENALTGAIEQKHGAFYVGRLTSDGMRQFYYYLGDTTHLDSSVSDAMRAFPGYRYDHGTQEDTNWSGYFDFLYPTPEERRCMLNHRIIEKLEAGGDNLSKERPVDHWIYFSAEDDRNAFIRAIDGQGFETRQSNAPETNDTYPYVLELSRVDKVDYQSVDKYVLYLWSLAQDHNGDYDGWGTTLLTGE